MRELSGSVSANPEAALCHIGLGTALFFVGPLQLPFVCGQHLDTTQQICIVSPFDPKGFSQSPISALFFQVYGGQPQLNGRGHIYIYIYIYSPSSWLNGSSVLLVTACCPGVIYDSDSASVTLAYQVPWREQTLDPLVAHASDLPVSQDDEI